MSATLTLGGTIGGISFGGTVTRTSSGTVTEEFTLAVGKAGTLSTRTDADTGIVTVESGHGITDAMTVGLYWSGGCRRGMDVTATDATTISINIGAGDDLPIATTAVVICFETTVNVDFVGNEALAAAVQGSRRCQVSWQLADGTEVVGVELGAAGEQNEWWAWALLETGGTANPFAAVTIGKVLASCGDSVNSCDVKLGVAKDSI